MTKETILNALSCCAKGTYAECYYYGLDDCDKKMCNDAASFLNASETTKAKPKYSFVWIYTKRTRLSAFLTDTVMMKRVPAGKVDAWREFYARERDVQLIAMFRFEKGKCFCKIKCPINPLPVKGEFEVPSCNALAAFLETNGWTFKEKLYPNMFT